MDVSALFMPETRGKMSINQQLPVNGRKKKVQASPHPLPEVRLACLACYLKV